MKRLAEKVWSMHETTTEEIRQSNIEKWLRAVEYLGPRWVAISMNGRKVS